jgi:hypothetical protein
MRRVRRLLELSREDRLLLLRAGFGVIAAALALRALSLRTAYTLLTRAPVSPGTGRSSVPRTAWAVQAAAHTLGAACLTQALALQWLLARRGEATRLWLGVRRPGRGTLAAHAWLEHEGRTLIGASSTDAYAPLTSFVSEAGAGVPEAGAGPS